MSDELTWMPAWEMRALVAKGEVSPVALCDHFLGRIEEHDGVLRTCSHVDAEGARQAARAAEAAVRRGDELGLLHGVPVTVKEQVTVAGFPVGSSVPGAAEVADARWHYDVVPVERLRAAGAVILGYNSAEGSGGGGRFPVAHYNWDAESRNPWDPSRVPGWSSSGSAAAVAAGLVPLALGGDGGGSTRLPAAYSGVVGLHTTPGLIPSVNYALPSLASLMGSHGPLARDVTDAALMVQAMAGPDGRDFGCFETEPPDYVGGLDQPLDGLRLAWTDDFGFAGRYGQPESEQVVATVRAAAARLGSSGASVEPTDLVWEDFWPHFLAAFPVAMLPGLTLIPPPAPADWEASLLVRQTNWQRFRQLFGHHDLVLSPTSQLVAWTVEDWDAAWTTGDEQFPGGTFAPTYCSHTMMFNWLGMPAVSVPCGFVDGLPVGLQIAGPSGSEARILQVAKAFLAAVPMERRPPGVQ
jgi:Asp-tRNA(Asn)/Glu-tRNA(Gln) amidotransferase A subunit family amidase